MRSDDRFGWRSAAVLAALLAACGQDAGPKSPSPEAPVVAPASASRPAFQAPALATVDAAVREQVDAALRRVEETRAAGSSAAGNGPAGEAAATAWLRLGQLYHAYDLLDPAAAAYENAVFDAPGSAAGASANHGLGLVRQRQGRLEDAARLFRQELAKAPTAAANYRLGQVEKAAGRPAEARAALEAARGADLGCLAAVYELGLLAAQEGRLEEAVAHFEEVLARQPAAVQAHFPLGQALQRLGRAEAAKPHLAASAAREVSVGGRASCADAFEAELRPLTTGAAAHITRGQAARFSGDMKSAIAEFRQAVAVAPDDPIAHQALGRALAGQGDYAGALAEYRTATRLDPQAAELKVDLGLLLEQKGERAEAGQLFREALAKNAALPAAHFGLARLALAEGKADPALAGLARVLELEPGNAHARGLRVELLMQLQRPAEALEDVRHLLDQNPPEDPLEHASLAWAAAALGDKQRAFEHLRRVAGEPKADPKARAAAHYRLASLLLEKNDAPAARKELEAALVQDPGLEPARRLLERLPK